METIVFVQKNLISMGKIILTRQLTTNKTVLNMYRATATIVQCCFTSCAVIEILLTHTHTHTNSRTHTHTLQESLSRVGSDDGLC